MMLNLSYNKRILAVITGSSQGIGKTIATTLAHKLANDSKIILVARSEKNLNEAKLLINDINSNIIVHSYALDLSKPNKEEYEDIFKKSNITDQYDIGMIFHNAGQVGHLKKCTKLNKLEDWRSYYDMNLFSASILNSVFLTVARPNIPKIFVVNISSINARRAMDNMAMYCSVKAARDLFFSVLAVEEPEIAVLNYSPGPVDTNMFNSIAVDAESDQLKARFNSLKKDGVLTTEQTVSKLLQLLEQGQFKSGEFVDYFGRT